MHSGWLAQESQEKGACPLSIPIYWRIFPSKVGSRRGPPPTLGLPDFLAAELVASRAQGPGPAK